MATTSQHMKHKLADHEDKAAKKRKLDCKPLEIKYKATKAVEAGKKNKIEIAAEFYYFSVPLSLKNIGADATFAVNLTPSVRKLVPEGCISR